MKGVATGLLVDQTEVVSEVLEEVVGEMVAFGVAVEVAFEVVVEEDIEVVAFDFLAAFAVEGSMFVLAACVVEQAEKENQELQCRQPDLAAMIVVSHPGSDLVDVLGVVHYAHTMVRGDLYELD